MPSARTAPASGRRWPARIASRLDLPAPLRPVTTSASPFGERERQVLEDEPPGAAAGEVLDGDPHPGGPLRQAQIATVRTRVAGAFEMIYTAPGCAARYTASKPSRAHSNVRAPPGRRAHSALRPDTCSFTRSRGHRRGNARQLQRPPDPHGRRQGLHLLLARRGREERPAGVSRLPFSMKVLLENLLRYEDGRTVTKADIEAVAAWLDNKRQGREGDRLPPGARADAGLHRRAGRRRPRRHARRDEEPRRRPAQDQPAGAGRSRHRPLGHRRRVRHAAGLRQERRARISSATASATGS